MGRAARIAALKGTPVLMSRAFFPTALRASFRRRLRVIRRFPPPGEVARLLLSRGTLELWGLGISVQHGAQRILEGAEPGLEMLPVLDRIPEDGTTHLLGARRAHRSLGAIEMQAILVEIQATGG